MPDNTLSRLLHLVSDSDAKDLRAAAIRVLGKVGGPTERNVVKTLLEVLADSDEELRVAAIEALGQLQAEEALKPLEASFARECRT